MERRMRIDIEKKRGKRNESRKKKNESNAIMTLADHHHGYTAHAALRHRANAPKIPLRQMVSLRKTVNM